MTGPDDTGQVEIIWRGVVHYNFIYNSPPDSLQINVSFWSLFSKVWQVQTTLVKISSHGLYKYLKEKYSSEQ